jgi:hypothetical protein
MGGSKRGRCRPLRRCERRCGANADGLNSSSPGRYGLVDALVTQPYLRLWDCPDSVDSSVGSGRMLRSLFRGGF